MVPKCKILKYLPCVMLPTASLAVDIAEQSNIIKPNTIFFKRFDDKYSNTAQGNFIVVSIDPDIDTKKFWAVYDKIQNQSMYMETYIFNQLIPLENLGDKISACADGLEFDEGENEYTTALDNIAATLNTSLRKLFGTDRTFELAFPKEDTENKNESEE